MSPLPAWLAEIYGHVQRSQPDSAIDVLFAEFDDLLSGGDFAAADDVLTGLDLYRLDTSLLVGALSISAAASEHLPGRGRFVERVEARLQQLAPGRVERLMSGLR